MSERSSPIEVDDKQKISLEPANNATAATMQVSSAMSDNVHQSNEKSFDTMLEDVHTDVMAALGEAQNVTTHDNNLEKQYRQIAEENSKLTAQLSRARKEITRLQGQLAILQLTPSEIREQKYIHLLQQKKRQIRDMQLQSKIKGRNLQQLISVMSYQARSQTVNAKGQYIDSSAFKHRKRHKTFPLITTPGKAANKLETLPPALPGCHCSVCYSQQSLGALCLNKAPQSATKSGQQILLGDRVIVQGNEFGTVKYIGKLEFDALNRIFIGIQLDAPNGITDGTLRGRQYFQCPQSHGIFVLPHDVLSVTGRNSIFSGTNLPRATKNVLTPTKILSQTRSVSKPSTCTPPPLSHTPDPLAIAEMTVNRELQQLFNEKQTIENLTTPSVSIMAQRMSELKGRSHSPNQPVTKSSLSSREGRVTAITPESVLLNNQEQDQEETTLTQSIVTALQKKDLGQSGYVTLTELSSVLTSDTFKLSQLEVNEVINKLGLQNTERQGIDYLSMATDIAKVIGQLKAANN